MKLSIKLLKRVQACQGGIDFIVRNKLIGYPIDRLGDIEGDYEGYVNWMLGSSVVMLPPIVDCEYPTIEYMDGDIRVEHRVRSGTHEQWTMYDAANNVVYYCDSLGGYAIWRDYDDNGNIIHSIDTSGTTTDSDYNVAGDRIHFCDKGAGRHFEWWKIYDDNGHVINYRTVDGYEHWYEYDAAGNILNYRDSLGCGYTAEYDVDNNRIHFCDSQGEGIERWMVYEDNLIRSFRDNNGTDVLYEYDRVGNLIRTTGSDVMENLTEFYADGQLKSIGDCIIPHISDLV